MKFNKSNHLQFNGYPSKFDPIKNSNDHSRTDGILPETPKLALSSNNQTNQTDNTLHRMFKNGDDIDNSSIDVSNISMIEREY
jgi:hypothetical protein